MIGTVRRDSKYLFAWVEAPTGLERVFSVGHRYHDRIFYDPDQGQYYDQGTDLYLSLNEAKGFGIPT